MVCGRLHFDVRHAIPVVGLIAAFAGDHAVADLYRWVDAKGVVNYSNIPPQGVDAKRIAETEPTVSVIPPPPEKQPELKQAVREAALLRRIEQLEDELAALRRASAPAVVYAYPDPAPVPTVTYSAPVVYPFPIYSWPVTKPGFGHRFKPGIGHGFKPGKPGFASHRHVGGRPAGVMPRGGRSGLTVRAGF